MKKTILYSFLIMLSLTMCNRDNTKEKTLKTIQAIEKEYSTNNTLEKAQSLIDMYENYVQSYPEDTLSPEFLFRCASVASATQQINYAIKLYQRLYDEYPESQWRPDALLQQALIHDNMEEKEQAKLLYMQFLDVFPEHPYSLEVQKLLSLIDKTPKELEEIIQQWNNIDTIGE